MKQRTPPIAAVLLAFIILVCALGAIRLTTALLADSQADPAPEAVPVAGVVVRSIETTAAPTQADSTRLIIQQILSRMEAEQGPMSEAEVEARIQDMLQCSPPDEL